MDAETRRKLEELRRTIAGATPADEEGAKLLKSLDQDIHGLLARTPGAPAGGPAAGEDEPAGVRERWDRAVEHFEATHPDLTASLSRALDLLAAGGL